MATELDKSLSLLFTQAIFTPRWSAVFFSLYLKLPAPASMQARTPGRMGTSARSPDLLLLQGVPLLLQSWDQLPNALWDIFSFSTHKWFSHTWEVPSRRSLCGSGLEVCFMHACTPTPPTHAHAHAHTRTRARTQSRHAVRLCEVSPKLAGQVSLYTGTLRSVAYAIA